MPDLFFTKHNYDILKDFLHANKMPMNNIISIDFCILHTVGNMYVFDLAFKHLEMQSKNIVFTKKDSSVLHLCLSHFCMEKIPTL